jgi:hypothetical protein
MKTPTTSPKKASLRSAARAPTAVDLESSKTRGGRLYSSLKSKSRDLKLGNVLRKLLEAAESDPFLESAPSTTRHANVALESVEPQNELNWEELLSKVETQKEFLAARNRTLTEETANLKNQLQESDEKVKEVERLKEQNENLQNKVAVLEESE